MHDSVSSKIKLSQKQSICDEKEGSRSPSAEWLLKVYVEEEDEDYKTIS